MWRIAGIFCVAVALASPAAAQFVRNGPPGAERCIYPTTFYTAASPDAPPAIQRAIADSHGTIVFRTCKDDTGIRTYLRAPAPTRDGVCRFFEIEVAAARGRKRNGDQAGAAPPVEWWNPPDGWDVGGPEGFERQPWLFMTLAEGGGGCPPFDGLRYAHAENVSDGLFKAISHLTGALLVSLPALDTALAHVPAEERGSTGVGVLRLVVASGAPSGSTRSR
jgi:hypothetical protein